MGHHLSRVSIVVLLSSVLALAFAGPSFGMAVSGQQKIVNEAAGKFKMKGDLLGKFKITAFKQTHTSPVFQAKGKEKFKGCLDVDGDRSCAGDPSGVLRFKFRFWAAIDEDGALQLGTCSHPVVRGKGDFAGATGFLMMVDRPKKSKPFVKTRYEGVIDLAGSSNRVTSEEVPTHC